MHESVMDWVGKVAKAIPGTDGHVLEIGSADVNGSIRGLFPDASYWGIDIVEGPGVDQVVEPGDPLPTGGVLWDVVVTTEMLEHDVYPWKTIANIYDTMADGGHLILTCRGFDHTGSFGFHNPPDRWRYSRDAIQALASSAGFENFNIQRDPQAIGWFLLAKK